MIITIINLLLKYMISHKVLEYKYLLNVNTLNLMSWKNNMVKPLVLIF